MLSAHWALCTRLVFSERAHRIPRKISPQIAWKMTTPPTLWRRCLVFFKFPIDGNARDSYGIGGSDSERNCDRLRSENAKSQLTMGGYGVSKLVPFTLSLSLSSTVPPPS